MCRGNLCPWPPQARRQCNLPPSPCPCSYSQLPFLTWPRVPQVGPAIRDLLGCWNVVALPGARLISENPAWVVQIGGCRVSAAWHSSWAQLLTFLSRDKSPLCELPLCGEHGSSSLQSGVCRPLPIPCPPQQLSLGRGLEVHEEAHLSPSHVPVPLDMKP